MAFNNLVIEKENVCIDDAKGLLKTYEDSGTSSVLTTPRSFCSTCGRCVSIVGEGLLSAYACQSYLRSAYGHGSITYPHVRSIPADIAASV